MVDKGKLLQNHQYAILSYTDTYLMETVVVKK